MDSIKPHASKCESSICGCVCLQYWYIFGKLCCWIAPSKCKINYLSAYWTLSFSAFVFAESITHTIAHRRLNNITVRKYIIFQTTASSAETMIISTIRKNSFRTTLTGVESVIFSKILANTHNVKFHEQRWTNQI